MPTQVGIHGGWLIMLPAAMDPDLRQEYGRSARVALTPKVDILIQARQGQIKHAGLSGDVPKYGALSRYHAHERGYRLIPQAFDWLQIYPRQIDWQGDGAVNA